jgi:hypothetical protein
MSDVNVAVLFARNDSYYKSIPVCDVWDIDRDARKWPGGAPVVAHPPCRAWASLRFHAKPREGEKQLAIDAVAHVRKFGGVLEHPHRSTLWPTAALPEPGERDQFGGFTLPIDQHWWGHRASKRTLLYVVGVDPRNVPTLPMVMTEPTHVIGDCGRASLGNKKPEISKAEREHTPPELARWLVDLAARCKTISQSHAKAPG